MARQASAITPDPHLIRHIERLAELARAEGLDAADELLADVLALLHGWTPAHPTVTRPFRAMPVLRLLPGGRA